MSDASLVSLYSPDQVRRLTGLSARQLSYWDKTGFFQPALPNDDGERFGRVYSFQDLVGLRVIALMRQRVPLQELRRVGAWLDEHRDSWAGRQFWIRGRRVYWDDDIGQRVGTRQPQQVEMRIEMDAVSQDMRAAIAAFRKRDPAQVGQLERRRYTVGNDQVIAGTRIPTRAIWQMHRAGYSRKAIRTEFPRLTDRDIAAALESEEHRRAS
ncbi:MAG TPA: DUF433 domain-containing protein [Candidatus Dormibacteraeota bacterium]|nr:DUF433 domain-containing protein [Candidatus Dormibacteraeota bacterium]